MLCPECLGKTRVIGTFTSLENNRYRRCPDCGHSFTTIEKILGAVNTHQEPKKEDKGSTTNNVVQEYNQ